jgi:hypothetical protein
MLALQSHIDGLRRFAAPFLLSLLLGLAAVRQSVRREMKEYPL